MAITNAVQAKYGPTQGPSRVFFTTAFTTGTNYATGGVVVDLSAILKGPWRFQDLLQINMTLGNGYDIVYVPGADLTLAKFQIFTSGGTELANATSLNLFNVSGIAYFAYGAAGIL